MEDVNQVVVDSTPESVPSFRAQLIAAAVLAGIALVAYVCTAYPDLTGGDSAELVGVVASGGVIHPPGYPLYFLLGKLFIHWPFGTLAWRMGLMSAVCCACASGLLCLAVTRITKLLWAGVATAGLFALSPGVWQYAIRAEVFGLNNLLVALLLLLAVLQIETGRYRYARLFAFVFGLGLSNHHTIVFVAAPLGVWIAWTSRDAFWKPRMLAVLAASFLAGLLPYLVLPITGGHAALVSWGATDTWTGFWTHVLRREYGTFQLAVTGVGSDVPTGSIVSAWLEDLVKQVGFWGIGLAAVGLGTGLRATSAALRGLSVAVCAAMGLSVVLFAALANVSVSDPFHLGVIARFWQQPDLLVCVGCGLGLNALRGRFAWRWLAPGIAGIAVVWQGAAHASDMDRHTDTIERVFAGEIMRAIPQGALVITRGDFITNGLRYLQAAERQRPDVKIMDQELMGFDWAKLRFAALYPQIAVPGKRLAPADARGYAIKDVVAANLDRVPIIICGGFKYPDPSFDTDFVRLPLGICEQVYRTSRAPTIDQWLALSEVALPKLDLGHLQASADNTQNVVVHDYWTAREMRAFELITFAGHDPARKRYLQMAADMLHDLVRHSSSASPLDYKMLATAIALTGLATPESRRAAADAWRSYLRVAPESDPMLSAIREELQRLERQ